METQKVSDVLKTVVKSGKNREVLLAGLKASSKGPDDYLDKAYETLWRVQKGTKPLSEVFSLIRKEALLWGCPEFQEYKNKEVEQDNFIANPFEVEEGVLECTKRNLVNGKYVICGSKRVFSFQKQTRGLDEPATTFAQCVKCGAKWTS